MSQCHDNWDYMLTKNVSLLFSPNKERWEDVETVTEIIYVF